MIRWRPVCDHGLMALCRPFSTNMSRHFFLVPQAIPPLRDSSGAWGFPDLSYYKHDARTVLLVRRRWSLNRYVTAVVARSLLLLGKTEFIG
jgi:hypothetical protein